MSQLAVSTAHDSSRTDIEIEAAIGFTSGAIPVERTTAVPAFLQINDELQITWFVGGPLADLAGEIVQVLAEFDPQVTIDHKVVGKVIQHPMPYGSESTDSNDPPIIVEAVDCPFKPGE